MSLFRVCRPDGPRSGGKILRGRRPAPPSSPYFRPEKSPSPPPPNAQPGTSTWISGLLSGAGKLISSVFRSESDSISSSSSYSSDEEVGHSSYECDDIDVSSKEPQEFKQIEERSVSAKDCIGRSLAIISEIDTKHAIEQLIMQETFSRDECSKLTKIIQSRVDFPLMEAREDGRHKELLDRTNGNAIAFPEAWQHLHQSRKLPETVSYSSSSQNAISPGGLRNSAVMEAKKWLKDKKLDSSLQVDCRCCTLNTSLPTYDIEGEAGSPVNTAKSYMQSLSPWKSPPLSDTGMHIHKDEAPYATYNYSSPSSKVHKRDYLAFGSRGSIDEMRRVRLKSAEAVSDSSKFKLLDSSARCLDSGHKILSPADERTCHDSSSLPSSKPLDAGELSAKLCFTDYCSAGAHSLPDEKTVDVNHPLETGNATCLNLISEAEAAVIATQSTHENASPTTLQPYSGSVSGPQSCKSAIPILVENQDVEKPLQIKERHDNASVPCDSLILAPSSAVHDGDHSDDLSETKIMPSVDIKSGPSDVDAVSELNDASSIQMISDVEKNSSHQEQVSSVNGSKLQDGNGRIQNEENGLRISEDSCTTGVSAKPSLTSEEEPNLIDSSIGKMAAETSKESAKPSLTSEEEPNLIDSSNGEMAAGTSKESAKPSLTSEEEPNLIDSSNGEMAAGTSKETHELLSVATTGIPVNNTNRIRAKSQGVKKMKSVKEVPTEPQTSTSGTRRKKTVPGPRRGRGK